MTTAVRPGVLEHECDARHQTFKLLAIMVLLAAWVRPDGLLLVSLAHAHARDALPYMCGV